MYRKNPLKKKLLAGEQTVGCWLHLCSPMAAEIVGLAGFDMVIIDHEHGPSDFLNTIGIMQALSATDTASVMRVPWNDTVYIKRALDIGVEGILVPSVDTVEQAEAVVRACRYPPDGVRGAAYSLVRCSDYGFKAAEYFEDQPNEVLVICQIESITAVENVEAIAAVEGIDMLFVGPFDLSASMGILGQTDRADFIAVRERAEKAIKASGKKLGGLASKGDPPTAMKARGYDLVTGVSDVMLLRDAAVAHLKTMK